MFASARIQPSALRFLGVLLAGMLLASCGINTILTLHEHAKAAWSEVLNQYQRRADLIPNLVNTVKGYATQEREVLTQVTEARAKATQVQVNANQLTDPEAIRRFQEAQAQLSGALGRLRAAAGHCRWQHRVWRPPVEPSRGFAGDHCCRSLSR